jgi:endonuclease YncB( thermonuclease family)
MRRKKLLDLCTEVFDGNTFGTLTGKIVQLANVFAPETNKPGGTQAKRNLEELILYRQIAYTQVGTFYGNIVADVSVNGSSVNDAMNKLGYPCFRTLS